MKILVSILILAIGASALATPIPANRLSEYKEALRIAIHKGNEDPGYTCLADLGPQKGQRPLLLGDQIGDFAAAGEVSSNGAQPLLIFTSSSDGFISESVTFTTSIDMKSVIQVEWNIYTVMDVNVGDLQNPKIAKQPTLTAHGACYQN